MYAVNVNELGTVLSHTLLYQLVAMILTSVVAGYIYDIFGRKLTVAFSYLLLCGTMMLIPLCSPSISALSYTRALIGVGLAIQIGNPFINDYVRKETRGRAAMF